jgi:hypothetical protein
MAKSAKGFLSSNFEWIFFPDDGNHIYSVTKDGLPPIDWAGRGVSSEAVSKTKQDTTAREAVEISYHRSTFFNDHLRIADGRRYDYGHSFVYLSACGRYTVMAMDSSQKHMNAHLMLWLISTKPREQSHWNGIRIANAEIMGFRDAKIPVNFDAFNPVCILTFWVRPDSGMDKALCNIHCFVLDLPKATISHHLKPFAIRLEGPSILPLEQVAPRFNGSLTQAWIWQMDVMQRLVTLSKCGKYLVLSATIGSARHQQIIDLPSTYEPKSKGKAPESTLQDNPRVIEPKMTFWHQHFYWMSVYRQRILLHRSTRSVTNTNAFSSLSCHVHLGVLPAHLAGAKAWLLVPESNTAGMTVLVTTKDNPPELWKLKTSWNTAVGKLDELGMLNREAIVALMDEHLTYK